uniref:Uncharacterized protein n=1 Tax=Glossina pallidipes TaxID=7398 RepID=A0A1A9ZNV1_GLOPL
MRFNVAPGVSALVSLKVFSTLLTTKLSSVLISSQASGSISSHKSTTSSKSRKSNSYKAFCTKAANSGGKSFKSSLRCFTIEFDTILVVVNFPPESEALDDSLSGNVSLISESLEFLLALNTSISPCTSFSFDYL